VVARSARLFDPVTARGVARTALAIYLRRFIVLAGLAVAVFAVFALIEAFAGEHLGEAVRSGRWLDAGVLVVVSGLWLLGSTVYVGICDRIVEAEFAHRPITAVQVVRGLPYGRLVPLEVLSTMVVAAGLALLLLPGLVVFTLTCLAAPLVMMEGLGVVPALRRSATLAWPHFWLVVGLVTVPITLEHELLALLEALTHLPFAVLAVVHVLALSLVVAPLLLAEVVLAYELVARDISEAGDDGTRRGHRDVSDSDAGSQRAHLGAR